MGFGVHGGTQQLIDAVAGLRKLLAQGLIGFHGLLYFGVLQYRGRQWGIRGMGLLFQLIGPFLVDQRLNGVEALFDQALLEFEYLLFEPGNVLLAVND